MGILDQHSGLKGEFVQSLARGIAVIRAFSPLKPTMTLSEVSRETGLNRAAARRFLHTLVELGYVRTDGRLFSLTPRVMDLGYAYLSSLEFPDVARPHLQALSNKLNESTSAAVLDDTEIVYVARVPAHRIMSVNITLGTRFAAHATSLGRVLLAGLSPTDLEEYLSAIDPEAFTSKTVTNVDELHDVLAEVREQGWALVDQELELGLRAIAAPITDASNTVVAAINLSTSSTSVPHELVRGEYLQALLATAEDISTDLHHL